MLDNLQKEIEFIKSCPHYRIFAIDLFCGAGGETTGIELATVAGEKCAKVIACVNHDPNAIASHSANHKDVLHYIEDIRTLNVGGLETLAETVRKYHPKSFLMLHASAECTNFSKAKGGMPREADSRTLVEHLFRYIEAVDPDYMQIENVEEFMCWGDLDQHGKPVSKDKGSSYIKWVNKVKGYGYDFDYRILNSADFGAYTSRKRYFALFAKHGLPIVFPEQTYAKNGDEGGLFSQYKKWKPVREVLNLDDEGRSIFDRKKTLCEATLERIYAGLVKFVAGGKQKCDAWILKYNSMNKDRSHNAPSLDEPCPTVAVQNRLGLCKCNFLSLYYGGAEHNQSIEEPAGTVTTKDHHAFLSVHYSKAVNRELSKPSPTVTCQDRIELISSQFLDSQYGNGTPSDIKVPSPVVTTNPKQSIVTAKRWLANTNFKNVGSSLDAPAPVVTANHKYHYLMNPQFASAGGSIDNPCFTLIARMDKMPPYLISTECGIGIAVYEDDSPMTKKVKEFMAAYGIVDIKMRMLNVNELKRIMGFPDDYVLIGTQAEQKKYIGNAVEVNMGRVLCEALAASLMKKNIAI